MKMAFTRIAQLNDPIAALDDRVSGQADTLKAYFDRSPTQLLQAINDLMAELEAQSAGDSVGVAAAGLTATKLNAALAELKAAIDALVGGLIPEQSVTSARIADGAVTEEKLASAYKASLAGSIASVATAQAQLLTAHKEDSFAHSALFGAKADRVAGAGAQNIAVLTAAGNLADGGKKAADLMAKPAKVSSYTGGAVTLVDNTEYAFTGVTSLSILFPAGAFLSHLRISAAASGTVHVTFPGSARFLGRRPDIGNGETWEISVKNGVVAAGLEGDGA